MEDEILTAPEVAKMLGVTSASVNRWCAAGNFPGAYRINPFTKSAWRIPRESVEVFKQKRHQQYGFIRLPTAPSEQPPPKLMSSR